MCAPAAVQTSMMDSEYNLDPNCLSRCSTELLSEASWEQVDKQDTEVQRSLCRRAGRPALALGCSSEIIYRFQNKSTLHIQYNKLSLKIIRKVRVVMEI